MSSRERFGMDKGPEAGGSKENRKGEGQAVQVKGKQRCSCSTLRVMGLGLHPKVKKEES